MSKSDDDLTNLLLGPVVVADEDLLLVQLYRAMEDCCNICIHHNTCCGRLWCVKGGSRPRGTPIHRVDRNSSYVGIVEPADVIIGKMWRRSLSGTPGLEDNWDWLQRAYDAVKESRGGEPENWEEFHVSHPRLAESFHGQFLDAARESEEQGFIPFLF